MEGAGGLGHEPAPDSANLYFLGIRSAGSLAHRLVPRWARILGVNCRLSTIDLPRNAQRERYAAVLRRLREDENSVGMQVTSHKVRLFDVGELDALTEESRVLQEVGAVVRRERVLTGVATDLHALEAELPEVLDAVARPGLDVLLLGGGGAARAILLALGRCDVPDVQPLTVTVTERDEGRRRALREWVQTAAADLHCRVHGAERTSRLLASTPLRSVIINATGMGKDEPGSPLSDSDLFPDGSLVWDLNYRGSLTFLQQARRATGGVACRDGYSLFVRNWLWLMEEAFSVPHSWARYEAFALTPDGRRWVDA